MLFKITNNSKETPTEVTRFTGRSNKSHRLKSMPKRFFRNKIFELAEQSSELTTSADLQQRYLSTVGYLVSSICKLGQTVMFVALAWQVGHLKIRFLSEMQGEARDLTFEKLLGHYRLHGV